MEEHLQGKMKRIAVWAFTVIAGALLLYFLLFRYDVVKTGVSQLFAVLKPIIYGFVIAYILNPPMHVIENLILKVYARRKKKPGKRALTVTRLTSAILALLFMLLIVYALFALLLPELIKSIQNILANVPTYSAKIQSWYNSFVQEHGFNESTKEFMANTLGTAQDWISG
ncbi:MAG: AI-2E family transporter, partial [Proteobacteria bacterium]|nr:AI-2E family transporter [Pseudomonadota bacterium]